MVFILLFITLVDFAQVSSDDDDDESCDELQENSKIIGYQGSITPINRKPAIKSKKRKPSTIPRDRLRNDFEYTMFQLRLSIKINLMLINHHLVLLKN